MLIKAKKLSAIVLAANNKLGTNVYSLNHIFIDKDLSINASDGHCLYWAEADKQNPEDNFNMSIGIDRDIKESMSIPSDMVLKTLAGVPKKTPIKRFQNIEVATKENKIVLSTRDEKSLSSTEIANEAASYPNVEAIKNTVRGTAHEDKTTIGLSIQNLETLLRVAQKAGLKGLDPVFLKISTPESPIGVTLAKEDVEIKGVIMPMKC